MKSDTIRVTLHNVHTFSGLIRCCQTQDQSKKEQSFGIQNFIHPKLFGIQFLFDIEIGFEFTLLTYKVFSCKDLWSKFLGGRLLAVQSNTQSKL